MYGTSCQEKILPLLRAYTTFAAFVTQAFGAAGTVRAITATTLATAYCERTLQMHLCDRTFLSALLTAALCAPLAPPCINGRRAAGRQVGLASLISRYQRS